MGATEAHAAAWAALQPAKGKGKPTPEQVRACSLWFELGTRSPRCQPKSGGAPPLVFVAAAPQQQPAHMRSGAAAAPSTKPG